MSNPNREYELFVRDIVETLLKADGLTITVEHDVQVRGISRSHQVDVYWEYTLGGIRHRVIINCKNFASTVEVTHVETLAGVLTDMPGVRGVIVTTRGFQKGAVDYATVHQIGLKVIRPPIDQDWEGRIRTATIQLTIQRPILLAVNVSMNKAWAEAQPDQGKALMESASYVAAVTVVEDQDSGEVEDLNALWNRAMQGSSTAIDNEYVGTLTWSNAFLKSAGTADRKIDSIEFRWRYNYGSSTSTVVARDPKAIVKDAIDGSLLFVDPDGQVTGDTEKAERKGADAG